ncbi:unnamed protein product [Laminaria digitata]
MEEAPPPDGKGSDAGLRDSERKRRRKILPGGGGGVSHNGANSRTLASPGSRDGVDGEEGQSEGEAKPASVGPLPAFLDRTFAMVDEADSDCIVGWSANGDTFVIKRLDLFEEEVIPRFFNHRNLLSFVRQLNNHGEQ